MFRTAATVLTIALATLALLLVVALGQGWMARSQKTDLVAILLSATSSSNDVKDPLYLSPNDTQFEGQSIKEIGIRKANASDTLPAGLTNTPASDEMWVTPALKTLIDTHPLLQERYAKYTIKDTFPEELAPSPSSLMMLYGISQATVDANKPLLQQSEASDLWQAYDSYKNQSDGQSSLIRTVLILAGIILITPILLLVTEIARIGIRQREKRYAVLNLIGASNGQIRMLITAEVLPLSLLGSLLGLGVFIFAGAPALASLHIENATTWLHDVLLPTSTYIAICIVVIVCSVIASLQSMRSVKISALAVSRASNDMKRPLIFNILPLLLSVSGLIALATVGRSWYKDHSDFGGLILGVVLVMIIVGIFLAGSYIAYRLSGILVRLSRNVSTLVAARRLQTVPKKTFHSISGVVVALFAGTLLMTLFATVQTTYNHPYISADDIASSSDPLQAPLQASVSLPRSTTGAILDSTLMKIFINEERLPNFVSSAFIQKGFIGNDPENPARPLAGNYYESCAQLEQRTELLCPFSTKAVTPFVVTLQVTPGSNNTFDVQPRFTRVVPTDGRVFNDSYVLVAKDKQAFDSMIGIVYDITSEYHLETGGQAIVKYEQSSDSGPLQQLGNFRELIVIILIATIIIGGLSIFVSVTGSVFERKRTFVRFRIIGSSIPTLAGALFIEIFIPLIVISLIIIGLGILCCYYLLLILGALGDGHMIFAIPEVSFWLGLFAAIVLCAVLSLLNIPVLKKLTSLDEMRSE